MYTPFASLVDGNGLSVLGIMRDHRGLSPIQIPAVLDCDHGVGAGNDAAQVEAAVEITLIAAKEFPIMLRVLGNQRNHHTRGCLALALGDSFYIYHSGDERKRDDHRRAR